MIERMTTGAPNTTHGLSSPPERRAPGRVLRLAMLVALSAIACEGFPNHVSSSIDERFELDTSFVAVRHVAWTIGAKPGEPIETPAGFRDLALRVTVDRPYEPNGSSCQGATIAGIDVRVVPDDPALGSLPFDRPRGCDPEAIELTDACAPGCTGGATILVENVANPDYRVDAATIYVSLGGWPMSERHLPVELRRDPRVGEDASAAVVTTGRRSAPFDLGPSDPEITLEAVLHVSAAALRGPLAGLHGWLHVNFQSVDVKSGFGTSQTLTVGSLEPFRPERVVGGANVDVEWLGQCRAGADCEIPLALEVRSPGAGSLGPAARRDYYRWNVEATLVALDGRTLPPDAFRIEGPFDPIAP
jgi:hypothetical protein